MTEKKKRGRPPGNGKKAKLASKIDYKPVTSESYSGEKLSNSTIDEHPMYATSKMEAIAEVMEDVALAQKAITKLKKPAIDASPHSETLPSNWDTLSKVDKLQWLTAHRKK